jgi:uncharacterized protein YaiL (DUF2058 family)
MQSLREKLLKAGLVSEAAAKKAEVEKSAAPTSVAPSRSQDGRPSGPHRREMDRIPKLPPLPGSKEAHRLMSKRQLELDRAIREKVLSHQVPIDLGTTIFYFVTRKNRLRRLELAAGQAKMLEDGDLAVVERPDPDKIEHALVPPAVARELLALSERSVRFLNQPGAKVGFLSEAEIHARAAEATSGAEPEENEADADESPAESPSVPVTPSPDAPAQENPAGDKGTTYITIKRAPRS